MLPTAFKRSYLMFKPYGISIDKNPSNILGWNQKALIPTYCRFFGQTERPALRREDYVKQTRDIGLQDNNTAAQQGEENLKRVKEAAAAYNRGDGDGKLSPSGQKKSESPDDVKFGGVETPYDMLQKGKFDKAPRDTIQPTINKPSAYDSPSDWARIAGHKDGPETGKSEFEQKAQETVQNMKEGMQDLKDNITGNDTMKNVKDKMGEGAEGMKNLKDKVVEKGQELYGSAKETIKNVAEKLKK